MKIFFINLFWFLSAIKNTLLYKYACANVRSTQEKLLKSILKNNQDTLFGKKNNFKKIHNTKEWQSNVLLSSYDDYEIYIEQIKNGEKKVLTKEKIFLLEPTSGSSGDSKLIPYTKGLQKQFQQAIDPWIFNLIIKKPKILTGKNYWSISPNNKLDVDSAISIGFASDEEYLSSANKKLLKIIRPVPIEVQKINNMESFWYTSLLFLLKERSLSLISIWHPSWLEILLSKLDIYKNQLLEDIRLGKLNPPHTLENDLSNQLSKYLEVDIKRYEELKLILNKLKDYNEIWPNLQLISMWEDKQADFSLKKLKNKFPITTFQYKGLIATEGIVSFPYKRGKDYNLAIRSHFFEFRKIDEKNNFSEYKIGDKILLAHQLKRGHYYETIITTAGGLYRYRLGDIIKIEGFNKQCPLIKFVGRSNFISDIRGEKLNELFVAAILKKIFTKHKINFNFSMLAPVKKGGGIFYALFIENQDLSKEKLQGIKKDLDYNLSKNYHYENCCKLGQLQNTKIFLINKNANKTYFDRLKKEGMGLGNIKPIKLSKKFNWPDYFDGYFLK